MLPNYIDLAVPFFFLFIFIEIIFSYFSKKNLYRLNDSISSLSCGITEQVIEASLKTVGITMYLYVYENFRVSTLDLKSIFIWIICFILVDLAYYFFHRSSHHVNFIWATHIVHHQSEEYNLTTALRQSTLQNTLSAFYYLPLALVGFPLFMFIACYQINLIYQFFIHTKIIKKTGVFEKVMNTPSHHRVHHAKNLKYIDKNFAGVFIIWDKMFGTFMEEEDEPIYGIVSPVKTFNPIWLNLSYWKDLLVFSIKTPNWKDKILIWVKGPADLKLSAKEIPLENNFANQDETEKYDPKVSGNAKLYIFINFVLITIFSVKFLEIFNSLIVFNKIIYGFIILFTLASLGLLLEKNKNSKTIEGLRVVSTVVLLFLTYQLNSN